MLTKYCVTQRLFHREYGAVTIYRIEASWSVPADTGGFDGNDYIKGRFPPTIYWFGHDGFIDTFDDRDLVYYTEEQEYFEKQIIGIVDAN